MSTPGVDLFDGSRIHPSPSIQALEVRQLDGQDRDRGLSCLQVVVTVTLSASHGRSLSLRFWPSNLSVLLPRLAAAVPDRNRMSMEPVDVNVPGLVLPDSDLRVARLVADVV